MKIRINPSLLALAGIFLVGGLAAVAAPGDAVTDVSQAGPDYQIQGEYVGMAGGAKLGAQVIALGDGKFQGVFYPGGLPGDGWDGKTPARVEGKTVGELTNFGVADGPGWSGHGAEGKLFVRTDQGTKAVLTRVERKSPTLGMKAPNGAVVLFDGTSADAWQNGKVEDGLLTVGTRTKEAFGDFTLHLEFRTPFMPKARGQGRGNSGMYLQDRYEVQILDSFGLEGKDNECGGIYRQSVPKVNMCLPPLAWQTYDVDFQAARFDPSGQKTKNAVVTLRHNGVVIHDQLSLSDVTPGGGKNKEDATPGPIYIQNHGNPVHLRNIWIVKK